MTQMGIQVPPSQIFPDLGSDFATLRTLLSTLSRTDTLFWCARLNLLLCNSASDEITVQKYAVSLFLDEQEIRRLNTFASQHENVRFFFRAQMLELIRWTSLLADDHPGDGSTFNDPDVRRRFAQAALLASEVWANRTYKDCIVTTGNPEADRRQTMAAFRQSTEFNMRGPDIASMLARGSIIYGSAFRKHYEYADTDFLSATGISLTQYLACVCALGVHYLRIAPEDADRNPGGFNINAIGTHVAPGMVAALQRYFALDMQTPDALRTALIGARAAEGDFSGHEPFNPLPLRQRPILGTPDGRAIILDPTFYADKASTGPLFTIVEFLRKENRCAEAFKAFGLAFESYGCDVLRAMYPQAPHLSNRLSCNLLARSSDGDIEIADACLNDVTDVVFFEMKGVFIPHGADSYLGTLRQKYVVEVDRKGRTRPVGTGQLARSISLLVRGGMGDAEQSFRHARCIFPVLLAYDRALSSPGHSEFLSREFAQQLEPDSSLASGFMGKGRFLVAPLTVMTIEDLEGLQSSIENFRLVDFFRDYCNATKDGRRMSLRDFMIQSRHKYRFIYSKDLADRSMRVLQETVHLMFPGAHFPGDQERSADDIRGEASR